MRRYPLASLTVIAAATAFATPASAQPQAEWTFPTSRVMMSPLRFADIDGNGVDDVVMATMGPIGDPFSGGMVNVIGADGNPLPGWPVMITQPISGAALAIGDIDDDGDMEIVAESWFSVHVWNHDGSAYPGWPKSTGTTSTASPALADLDDDGDLEIIAPTGSTMHVWHHDGSEAAGWPRTAPENFQAASVGDVDGDGALEIVAGTWRPQFPDTVPFQLYMWSADGESETGFPIGDLGSVRGPVSLGDVDDDGAVEIVVRAGDTMHVFDAAGEEEPGWPKDVADPIRNSTPSLGDLDGDGDLEIVIGGFDVNAWHHDGTSVAGFPADVPATGNINSGLVIASIDDDATAPEIMVKIPNAIVALEADGDPVPGFPIDFTDDSQSATFSPTPVVGDVDGDGDVEYAVASVSGTVAYFDEVDPHSDSVAFWPMFQHDVRNTSFLGDAGGVPGDVDGDGDVDFKDLLLVLSGWGPCPPPPAECLADLDGSGEVGFADLLLVLTNWTS